MKKILFIILLFSLRGISQTPSGYTKLNVKYDFTAIKTDSGFHIPGYSTVPNIRTGIWVGSGNLGLDTILHRFYYYSDGWRSLVNLADSIDLNHYATQYDLTQLSFGGGGNNIYNVDSLLASNRTVTLNGKYFKIYDGVSDNLIIDPVEKQYFFGNQLSDIYGYLHIRDSVTTLNGGNNILESTVKLTLDALNIKAKVNVNGSEMLTLDNQTGEKATINSDSLYLTATSSGASVGNVLKLINPGTGSAVWGSVNSSLGTQSKSAFWEFQAAADTVIFWGGVPSNITVTAIKSINNGGSDATVSYRIWHSADKSSLTELTNGTVTCTSITTLCSSTSFTDATIAAGEMILIILSGGVGSGVSFTIYYTVD